MAEAIIISALLPLVFEKTASFIEQKLGVIFGADVGKELSKLRSTLLTIQAVLDDAEEKQSTNKALTLWLSNIKDAAYDADNVLDDFNLDVIEGKQDGHHPNHHNYLILTKIRRFFTCGSNPILFRGRMVHEIRDITERFDSLANERSKFHLREVAPVVDVRPPSHSYIPESEVVGRTNNVKEIVELLISQEHNKGVAVLPIAGMGGLGKTTLAQMVYNHPAVVDHFELRVWSFVTHDFSAAKVAKDMIETSTGSGFGLTDMDALQRNLRKLIGPKRYLLVLDDVWSEDPLRWEEVKIMLSFGAQGSSVVITTRSGKASFIMGTLGTHWLDQLSEEECWVLFSRRAFAGREEKPDLVALGRAIVKKSGMLPLAAKALGGLMYLKEDEKDWKAVLESEIWDLPLGQSGVLPALRLSYYNLPPQLKQCFGFCGLFPRGHAIEKEIIIKLWMANGFIMSSAKPTAMELKGREIFQELEQRSFFQDMKEVKRSYDGVRVTTCRMHDIIHDLARSIMGDQCCILDNTSASPAPGRGIRYLFVNSGGGEVASSSEEKKNAAAATRSLRTLLFSSNQPGVSISSWSGAKYLRVLSLHDTGLTELPASVCDFRHLRYLNLSRNKIETLPEDISRLLGLETLDLSGCGELLGLPNSISSMSSLMYLYLAGCGSLRSMPAGMRQLKCLRTLTRYVAGGEPGNGRVGELKDLDLHGSLELYNLQNVENVADAEAANLGSKKNLEHLDLDWGGGERSAEIAEEEVLQALQPHSKLKQLRIRRYRGAAYPKWLMVGLLSNLVEIVLADCSKCESLPQLWHLPYLETLEIGGVESMQEIGGGEFYGNAGVCNYNVFPSLKRLKLYGMPNLVEWSVLDGRPAFAKIETIEIFDCPRLRTVPALPSARSLQIRRCPLLHPANGFFGGMKALESLEMETCDNLVLMLEQEDLPGGSPLRHLHIKDCKWVMFSSPMSLGLWTYFSSLQNLEIRSCDGLVDFPVSVFRGLTSLKRLSMHWCYKLMAEGVGEDKGLSFEGLTALEELDVQICTKFPRFHPEGLKCLNALKTLRIYSNHGLRDLPDFPDSVREVTIYNCWNLKSLPSGLGRLPSLESFTILSCNWVTSFPEEMQGFKALKALKIEDCPRLGSISVGLQQRLPSLNSLEIKKTPMLERQCVAGGEYWNLVFQIPVKYIGD